MEGQEHCNLDWQRYTVQDLCKSPVHDPVELPPAIRYRDRDSDQLDGGDGR